MTALLKLPTMIILAVIIILHVLSFALRELYGKIAVFVNIALHIALFILLLFLEASMEEIAFAYILSLFVYLACALAAYRIVGRSKR
jgi:hypothetical protein